MDYETARVFFVPLGVILLMPFYLIFRKWLQGKLDIYGKWQIEAARKLGRGVGRFLARMKKKQ